MARRLAVAGTTLAVGLTAAIAPVSAQTQLGGVVGRVTKHADTAIGTVALGVGAGGSVANSFGPLLWGGGPVQHSPAVYIDFWGWNGSDPTGEAAYLQSFFNGVGGSGWANIQTQYTDGSGAVGNPTGQLKGVWFNNTTSPSTSPSDADVAAQALVAAAHFGYSADADYFIATPSGHSDPGFAGAGGSYCAYHASIADSSSRPVAFTNFPYQTDAGTSCGMNSVNAGSAGTLDGVSIVGGHEYAETVTDPQPDLGYVDAALQETGDKCAWISIGFGASQDITLSTGTFAVQTLWSNNADTAGVPQTGSTLGYGECVISYP
ncbi:MAG TPA: hypothetical protein VG245_10160 [Candidatus Dormibacteraeota bacterium]|jgi:serine protease|nr:hypothetical protein [Candidatus Dormibacteraeota bacterium]